MDQYVVQKRAPNWPHRWEDDTICSSKEQMIERAKWLNKKGYTTRIQREFTQRETVWPKPTKMGGAAAYNSALP